MVLLALGLLISVPSSQYTFLLILDLANLSSFFRSQLKVDLNRKACTLGKFPPSPMPEHLTYACISAIIIYNVYSPVDLLV